MSFREGTKIFELWPQLLEQLLSLCGDLLIFFNFSMRLESKSLYQTYIVFWPSLIFLLTGFDCTKMKFEQDRVKKVFETNIYNWCVQIMKHHAKCISCMELYFTMLSGDKICPARAPRLQDPRFRRWSPGWRWGRLYSRTSWKIQDMRWDNSVLQKCSLNATQTNKNKK